MYNRKIRKLKLKAAARHLPRESPLLFSLPTCQATWTGKNTSLASALFPWREGKEEGGRHLKNCALSLSGAHTHLTRRRRLDLGLGLLGVSSCKDVWRRVFAPLNLALKGIETLDILLFQGAGSTA